MAPARAPQPQRIHTGRDWPLFDTQGNRAIEAWALAAHPPHTLMQRAGLAVARMALAMAPHARCIWVAAGPGNNGGDGIEAALHLHRWGKPVLVTWLGADDRAPPDTAASRRRALAAGVPFADTPPPDADFCIDALLGIGATRPPEGRMAQWITQMQAQRLPVLSVDLPTGLDADTGSAAPVAVQALATLCLLTLKPGLFTAQGRDASAEVWLDDLGVPWTNAPALPCADLAGVPEARLRPHRSHKGDGGDVVVVGGATGMAGAVCLAATAALHGGAGRVFAALLDPSAAATALVDQPALMQCRVESLDASHRTVVCGCGGGEAIRTPMPQLLVTAARLVLDADALNAVAKDPALQQALRARAAAGQHTVLTPHPLEAARLLGCTTAEVQADRLRACQTLADTWDCTVVLKGSGSVIAAPATRPAVNPTGNALLATAGTGDVLAGLVGAALAQGLPAFDAARAAVFRHGLAADRWPAGRGFDAYALARNLTPLASAAR